MGLCRHDRKELMVKFNKYNEKENNKIIFKMYISNNNIYRKVISDIEINCSILYEPRRSEIEVVQEKKEQKTARVLINLSDSDSE